VVQDFKIREKKEKGERVEKDALDLDGWGGERARAARSAKYQGMGLTKGGSQVPDEL